MKAIKFRPDNIAIAEHQDEYETLHAHHNQVEGSVTYCFELSDEEIEYLLKTKRVYFKQITGNRAMQPVMPSVVEEHLIPQDEDSIANINVTEEVVEALPKADVKMKKVWLGKDNPKFKLDGVEYDATLDEKTGKYYYTVLEEVSATPKKNKKSK